MDKKLLRKALIPVMVWIGLMSILVPQGLPPHAWHYFALFVGVILGVLLEPIPAAAIGMIGVTLAAALHRVPTNPGAALKWSLSGFSNGTVWLIFVAYMFALGYEKTGLGRRIALFLVKHLGKKTVGLGYAIALSDLVLAPFIPSNTARQRRHHLSHYRKHSQIIRVRSGGDLPQDRLLYHVDCLGHDLRHQFHVSYRTRSEPYGPGIGE